MVLETIIIGVTALLVVVVVMFGGVFGVSSYKGIALGLAEISEAGKNTRERINARADYEPVYDESDSGESTGDGFMSEFDGLARLMNYDSAAAAMADPTLVSKVMGMLKTKKE